MSKSSLSTAEIDFVMSELYEAEPDNSPSRPATQAQSLARRLLIVFCVQSFGGAAVFRRVLTKVCCMSM
jgi:hypothetical protein